LGFGLRASGQRSIRNTTWARPLEHESTFWPKPKAQSPKPYFFFGINALGIRFGISGTSWKYSHEYVK
jgi:hypothetical protein